jgi:hypothetical protein
VTAWLEAQERALISPVFSQECPDHVGLAIRAWNFMGACIEWAALDVVIEKFGVLDVDTFITQLVALRDALAAKEAAAMMEQAKGRR